MDTKLFPCTNLADSILKGCARYATDYQAKYERKPKLAVVLIGEDPASTVYVSKKSETCIKNGVEPTDLRLPATISQEELVAEITKLNNDETVDGILVQSPLPKGLDEKAVQKLILPEKDVDSFHPKNVGGLWVDTKAYLDQGLPPCTPAGIVEVIKHNSIDLSGKHAVVIGRSNIVGKPMAAMLLSLNATVSICHSRTVDLAEFCRKADLIVSAVGKPQFLNTDFIKEGTALIDVGINHIERDGKFQLVGDVNRKSVLGKAGFLTPVPKGIGPMTIAMLIRNTVRSAWVRKARQSPI